MQNTKLQVAVWDTYVKRSDGKRMHFDILVSSEITDSNVIFDFGKQYLKTKPFAAGELTTRECRFCHIEQASAEIEELIAENGYAIVEMEHCRE